MNFGNGTGSMEEAFDFALGKLRYKKLRQEQEKVILKKH